MEWCRQFVVVLNSAEAVKAFAQGGNVTIGGKLSATAGPIGVGGAVDTSLINPSPIFTYSKSKGLFAGVSLEGTVLIERKDANQAFVSLMFFCLLIREREGLIVKEMDVNSTVKRFRRSSY